MQPDGRLGVDLPQARVQRRDPGRLRLGRQPPPHLRVDRRRVEQAAQQRLDVEPGAARDDRHLSRGVQREDQRPREPGEARGIEGLVRVHDIDQVVRHGRPLGRGRLGRADVHAPVDLHRVCADHLPVQGAGYRDPDTGLADGRRSADDDDAGSGVGDAFSRFRTHGSSHPRGQRDGRDEREKRTGRPPFGLLRPLGRFPKSIPLMPLGPPDAAG
jgi:hypothetical protein